MNNEMRSERTSKGSCDRDKLIRLADDLIASAIFAMTPNGALVVPGGSSALPRRVDGVQGFARSFLVAAFRNTAEQSDSLARYAEGLTAGVRGRILSRASSDTWPDPRVEPQCLVEGASIAAALHFSRSTIFDRLNGKDRQLICKWLETCLAVRYSANNWVLFPVIVRAFLLSTGMYSASLFRDENKRAGRLLESFYRGGGWYSDGPGNVYDHYNAWAIHFYRHLWMKMDPDGFGERERRSHLYRIGAFSHDYVHLIGGDGSPLFFGRSLIYRCAGAGTLFAAADAGVGPDAGLLRAAATAMVDYFLDQISPTKPPSLGWTVRDFPPMVQGYSSPASPYWMGKACFGLTTPADAYLWTSDEVDVPARERDFVRLLAAPNILISGTVQDGIVRAVNHGSSHYPSTLTDPGDPNYRKIFYSTVSAPGYEAADIADVGSTSTLLAARRVLARKDFQRLAGGRSYAASRWIARQRDQRSRRGNLILPGVVRAIINRSSSPVLNLARHRFRPIDDPHEVESHSVLFGQIEVRVTYRRSPAPIRVRDSGALVSSDDPTQILSSTSDIADPAQWASVRRTDGLTSTVVCLLGAVEPGVFTYEGVCPFGAYSRVPALTEVEMSAGEVTRASALLLGGFPLSPELIARDFSLTAVEPRLLEIHRGSTETRCWLALGEETYRRLVVGASELAGSFRFVRTERDEIVDVVGSTYRLTARRDRQAELK